MTLTRAISAEAMVPAKPFETSQQSQLKLIAPYVDLPLERLDGFSNKVEEIFRTAAQFDDGRAAKLLPLLRTESKCFDLIGHNLK